MTTQRPQRKPAGSGNPSSLMDVGQRIVSVSLATRAFSFLFQFLPRPVPECSTLRFISGSVPPWEVGRGSVHSTLCHIKLNTKTFSPKAEAVSVPARYLRESTASGSVETA